MGRERSREGSEGSEYEQCATRLMHCFAHCRIAADAGVDAAEVHLANKKNCINFIKFEMSSNCRALPAKCIHIQTNIFIYACGCVCVAERVLCVCGFTSAMTSLGGARLKAVVVAIASRFRFSWLRSAPATAAASGSASATAVGRVQFAAILKIVHQNPQSNLLRCFMTVLRAADFTPLKTTAQPTHNTHTHTQHTHLYATHILHAKAA